MDSLQYLEYKNFTNALSHLGKGYVSSAGTLTEANKSYPSYTIIPGKRSALRAEQVISLFERATKFINSEILNVALATSGQPNIAAVSNTPLLSELINGLKNGLSQFSARYAAATTRRKCCFCFSSKRGTVEVQGKKLRLQQVGEDLSSHATALQDWNIRQATLNGRQQEFADHMRQQVESEKNLITTYTALVDKNNDVVRSMTNATSIEELDRIYKAHAEIAHALSERFQTDLSKTQARAETVMEISRKILLGGKMFDDVYAEQHLLHTYRPLIERVEAATHAITHATSKQELDQLYQPIEQTVHGLVQQFRNDPNTTKSDPNTVAATLNKITNCAKAFDTAYADRYLSLHFNPDIETMTRITQLMSKAYTREYLEFIQQSFAQKAHWLEERFDACAETPKASPLLASRLSVAIVNGVQAFDAAYKARKVFLSHNEEKQEIFQHRALTRRISLHVKEANKNVTLLETRIQEMPLRDRMIQAPSLIRHLDEIQNSLRNDLLSLPQKPFTEMRQDTKELRQDIRGLLRKIGLITEPLRIKVEHIEERR